MKKTIKKIISYVILFVHNLSVSVKVFFVQLFYKIAGIFGYKSKAIPAKKLKIANKSNSSKSSTKVISSTNKSKEKTWWKNKYAIGGTAIIVICAIVIPIVISSNSSTGSNPSSAIAMVDEISKYETGEDQSNQLNLTNSVQNSSDSITESIPTSTPMPTPISTTEPVVEDLFPGITDSRVIAIQEKLMELGYLDWDEPSDYYGYWTKYALQLFQRKHNLQVDGIAGDATLVVLFSDEAKPYTVKLGDRGYDVISMQERLQALKYLKAGSTGYFGTDTEAAVKSFQKRNGLNADGNIGEQTKEVLFSENARVAATPSSSSSGSSSSGGSSSGGSTGNQPVVVGDPDNASADALIAFALTQLGKPYVRGGKGPSSFDCSGFVYYCLNNVGFKIGYRTSTAWRSTSFPTINKFSDVKKGDILCFNGHVGIYMGGGKMVDASSSNGKIVTRSNIFNSSYWTRNFRCAKRVF